jgi:hypothetical protein
MSYNQNERNEYCAALSTMILVTVVAIILIIKTIFNLWN